MPRRRYGRFRGRRMRRTYSMPTRRFAPKSKRMRRRRYFRVQRSLGSKPQRPHQSLLGNDNVVMTSALGFMIDYHSAIGQGGAQNQRIGDTLQNCPGGYLRVFLKINPLYRQLDTREIIRVRIITGILQNYDMTTAPATPEALFDAYHVTGINRLMANRSLNTYKMFKTLSDKVYTLDTVRSPYIKFFRKHNWKRMTKWDALANTPNQNFYYTIFLTDFPADTNGVAPVAGNVLWKTTWLPN